MPANDPSDRVLIARIASAERWSRVDDRAAATAPGRAAFITRFERQVDPDGTLDPAERTRRADLAKRAYFARLALKSVQARRRKATPSATAAPSAPAAHAS